MGSREEGWVPVYRVAVRAVPEQVIKQALISLSLPTIDRKFQHSKSLVERLPPNIIKNKHESDSQNQKVFNTSTLLKCT